MVSFYNKPVSILREETNFVCSYVLYASCNAKLKAKYEMENVNK